MDNDSFAKKFLTKSVFVLALGIFVAGIGFGYRQVKDANYLNTDTTRTIAVRGVSEMDVVSDRTIFDFMLTIKNVPEGKAAESFIKKEKDFYTKIPKNLISIIQKTGQSTYPTYGQIEPYAKTGYVVSGNYKIVLDNKSLDEIEATRSALLSAGVISEDLSYRHTLKNQIGRAHV